MKFGTGITGGEYAGLKITVLTVWQEQKNIFTFNVRRKKRLNCLASSPARCSRQEITQKVWFFAVSCGSMVISLMIDVFWTEFNCLLLAPGGYRFRRHAASVYRSIRRRLAQKQQNLSGGIEKSNILGHMLRKRPANPPPWPVSPIMWPLPVKPAGLRSKNKLRLIQ